MFDAAIDGLIQVAQWPSPAYLVIGVLIGLFFGAVPGLGGLIGLALLLPFTFDLQPVPAFALLLGMYAVVTTADTISSVLLGIPGTAASQATILDGYPMAQRGEAARALGAAFTVSMVGGVLGAVMLALSIPIVTPLVLSFASPEFFMLGLLGLTMVGALSGDSLMKGLAAAAAGVLLSTIGYAPVGTSPRFTFESTYLLAGLPMVPFVMGLFAIPELLELAVRGGSISGVARGEIKGGIIEGMRDAAREWWLGLRSTMIGVYVGMLPGIGGAVVDWIAYGHAVQSARDKSRFGTGDIRGVIAPEAANNAMKGGSLVPTVAFAIPGNASMAILLGAFAIQGLEPGMQMLTSRLDVTFSLVWTLVIANVIGAALLLVWAKQVSRVAFIEGHLIIPFIIPVVFMGSWITTGLLGDWISLLAFGVLGYLMKLAGWPRPPLVLGYLLGSIMENELHISFETHDYAWLTRPIVLVLGAIILLTIAIVVRGMMRQTESSAGQARSEGVVRHYGVAIALSVVMAGVFSYAAVMASGWRYLVGNFPMSVAIPGLVLALAAAAHDVFGGGRRRAASAATSRLVDAATVWKGVRFLSFLIAMLAVTLVAGQMIALALFVILYLRLWGGYRWVVVLPYAAAVAGFIHVMFEKVVPVLWYSSLLFS